MQKELLLGISGNLEDDEEADGNVMWFEPGEQMKLMQTAWEYAGGKRSLNYKVAQAMKFSFKDVTHVRDVTPPPKTYP